MNSQELIASVYEKIDMELRRSRRYPYNVKHGGKICTVCGMYSNLKNTSCTNCHIFFETLYSVRELETLTLEFAIANS